MGAVEEKFGGHQRAPSSGDHECLKFPLSSCWDFWTKEVDQPTDIAIHSHATNKA